jgi:tetratricopeptide (TPR) repeat protein
MNPMKRTDLLILLWIGSLIGMSHAAYQVTFDTDLPDETIAKIETVLKSKGWPRRARMGIGPFEYWPEAAYVKRVLEQETGARVGIWRVDAPAKRINVPKKIFDIKESAVTEVPDYKLDDRESLLEQLEQTLSDLERTQQIVQISLNLDDVSTSDPLRGWLLTKRGTLYLQRGKYEFAMADFKVVAEGKVAATRSDRVKAMRKFAWCLHRTKDLVGAYKAYDELENFSRDAATKATARMEKCGILMELARSGEKGTFDECRRAFAAALAEIDPSCEFERSTIALMDLQTYYYEGRYEQCLAKISDWLKTYPNQLRNKYMCLMFAAHANEALERFDESDQALLSILELPEPTTDAERFGSNGEVWDMKARALGWLAYYAEQRGDYEKAVYYTELLKQREEETKKMKDSPNHLPDDVF